MTCKHCRFFLEGKPYMCTHPRRLSCFTGPDQECEHYEGVLGDGPWEDRWLGGAILLAILITLGLTILIPIGLLCN